jgi:hypothetical protein
MVISTNADNPTIATISSSALIFEFQKAKPTLQSGVSGISAYSPDEIELNSEQNFGLAFSGVFR